MNQSRELQGEGNYDAAKEFNESERKFVESGKVERAAGQTAPKSDAEARELARAEEAGRERAKEEDPSVKRHPPHPALLPQKGAKEPAARTFRYEAPG
jgi:hypothetical protein